MLRKDRSFGVIPVRRSEQDWEVLMVCHRTGYWWSFPKGHAEQGELPQATAMRELQEETGLRVAHFLDVPTQDEAYQFRLKGERVEKQVAYFLAEVEGEITLQHEELVDARWIPLEEIEQRATYAEGKRVCREVVAILQRRGNS